MRWICHVLASVLLSACKGEPAEPPAGPPPSCPADMVMIPGGDYLLGRTIEVGEWDPLGQVGAPEGYWSLPNPAARLAVQPFCIDVFEYPNRRGEMPRVSVGWEEARRLCQESGKRLPSRTEWQAASQGREGRLYSYGTAFETGRCNTDARTGDFAAIAPAGSFPRCRTDLGVFDLDGNVSEWVEDNWEGPWYANHMWGAPEDEPKTMMGGTVWAGGVYGQDATSRHRHPPAQLWLDDGFRCAKSALAPTGRVGGLAAALKTRPLRHRKSPRTGDMS